MKSKIFEQLITSITLSEEMEIEIEELCGYNHKRFGEYYKASAILNGHPAHDRYSGIYYVIGLNKFFLHLTDTGHSPYINYTKNIQQSILSPWLQSKMIEVAKSGKCQSFPKNLILKGLKAKI